MDLATLIGLIGALIVITIAILLGGDFGTFVNIPSIVVVVGGLVLLLWQGFHWVSFLDHLRLV